MKNIKIRYALCFALCLAVILISAAWADNSNLFSSGGLYTYQDGYMYFASTEWTGRFLNDGRETGLPDSVEFYRIADVPGAEKELLASVPAAYIGGLGLNSGRYMIPAGNQLYFVRDWPTEPHQIDDILARVDLDSGETTTIGSMNTRSNGEPPFYPNENCIYFRNRTGKMMALDLATTETRQWETQIQYSNYDIDGIEGVDDAYVRDFLFSPFEFYDIQDGYVYYPDINPMAENPYERGSYCIYRMPVNGGERELVITCSEELALGHGDYIFIQDNMAVIFKDDTIHFLDIAENKRIDQIPFPTYSDLWGDYGAIMNIADGKFYYFKEDGLYAKTIGEDDDARLITGDAREAEALTFGKNYIYFYKNRTMYRLPRDARFMEEAEILLYPTREPDLQKEEDWEFTEYENCVAVNDYIGTESSVTVPSEIHGKPVVYVDMDYYSETNRVLEKLVIPEGVLRMGTIGARNLTDLSLPHSLIVMDNDGYPTAFPVAEGCVVHYAGTKAEWQALDDNSWTDYSSWIFKTLNELHIICTDGEWTKPGTEGEADSGSTGENKDEGAVGNTDEGEPDTDPLPELPQGAWCGDYQYTLQEDGTACITDYNGNEAEVILPDTLDGIPVTAVGEVAFAMLYDLKSVTIPSSVTAIGDSAFFGCTALESVTIPDSIVKLGANPFIYCEKLADIEISPENPNYEIVDGMVFDKNEHRLICCPGGVGYTSYTIPEGTEIIGEAAFYGCSRISTIHIPDTVTTIEEEAFYAFGGLDRLYFPESVTRIGENALDECPNLTAYVFYGSYADQYCGEHQIAVHYYPFYRIGEKMNQIGIANRKVNLREMAGTTYNALAQIPSGAEVQVTAIGSNALGEEAKWAQAAYGDLKGYIMLEYVDLPETMNQGNPSDSGEEPALPAGNSAEQENNANVLPIIPDDSETNVLPIIPDNSETNVLPVIP
ncbi:MAG: leucine-rich repeat domain-containing protein [Clostridia bacterium]|nr:leucine-rich repeat domain-containing protein [Clostridia bacterium]